MLVVEGKYQPVNVSANFDNSLSQALGRTTVGAGLDLNSVMGLGELVYLRAAGHPGSGDAGFFEQFPRNRTLAAGVVIPLWLDGLTFNAEYTDARTTPVVTNGIRTTSEFDRLSLRIRYAWLRGRMSNFSSELAFDAQNETQSLFQNGVPVPLSEDRLRVIRFVNEGDVITPWGATISGRATASFGIDALGARSAASASLLLPLSRQGADASFEKLDVVLNYQQSLVEHLNITVVMRAQTSFGKPLLRSEQIGIANTSGLSAFDVGTIAGDQGFVLRGELISPWQVTQFALATPGETMVGVVAAPYLFASYGEVSLQNPTLLEPAHIRATSFGGGLRKRVSL